jgi:hypothetical protein
VRRSFSLGLSIAPVARITASPLNDTLSIFQPAEVIFILWLLQPPTLAYRFALLAAEGICGTLSALAAGATGEVRLNLKASTTTGARPPLLLQAAWKDSGGQILAQVSDAKAIYAVPALSYALTTPTDPIGAGQALQFKVTITNLTTASQYVTLYYHVPNFTVDGTYPAGTLFSYIVGYVAVGASQSVNLAGFTVLGASQAPKGSLIILVVSDTARGASVSRTVTVK